MRSTLGTRKLYLSVGKFDELAGQHHRNSVAHLARDREAVADERQNGAGRIAQVPERIPDLRLHRSAE
jgi:hypothetical protein